MGEKLVAVQEEVDAWHGGRGVAVEEEVEAAVDSLVGEEVQDQELLVDALLLSLVVPEASFHVHAFVTCP